jgi:hypothetical protein
MSAEGLQAALHARQGNWQKAREDLENAVSMADHEEGLDPGLRASLLHSYARVLRKNHQRREAHLIEARAAATQGYWVTNALVDVTELSDKPKAAK